MCFAVGSTHLVDTPCWREPGTAVPPMGVHRSIRPSPRGSRRAGPLPQATARRDRLRCGGGRDPTFRRMPQLMRRQGGCHVLGRCDGVGRGRGQFAALETADRPGSPVVDARVTGRQSRPVPVRATSGGECQHVVTSKDAVAGVSGPTQPPGTRTNDRARVAVRPAGYRTSSMGSYRRPGARDVVTPASLVRRRYPGRRPRWNPRS